jgi:t-SNARE complex subunit (syntaxin)
MDQDPDLQRIAQSLEKIEQLWGESFRYERAKWEEWDKEQKHWREEREKLNTQVDDIIKQSAQMAARRTDRFFFILVLCFIALIVVQVFLILNLHK